jgi:sulfonate transport system substrate-binding protein
VQANARRSYQVAPVSRDGLAEQQRIADAFLAERVIPFKVDAGAARIWAPAP